MAFSKIIMNGQTLMDVTDTTATAGGVLDDTYFYAPSGVKTEGTIEQKTGADLTASGDTVTVPAGLYSSQVTKSVASGSAETPATTISVTPSISISNAGLITASVSATESVTPTVSAGYISSGAAGTITVSGSNTNQMTARSSSDLTVSTLTVTAPAGYYPADAAKTLSDANLSAENIKDGVTIFGVSGSYSGTDVSDTTATDGDVLSGKYFYTSDGVKTQGSLVIQHYYTGSSEPSSSTGEDGDIYLKASS